MRNSPRTVGFSFGAAADPLLLPDTVIGNRTSTYVLTAGGNPFSVAAATTIATTAGDGIDGASGTRWTLSNAGTIDGRVAGVSLRAHGAITNTGAIAGASGPGIVLGDGGSVVSRKGATIQGVATLVAGATAAQKAGVSVSGAAGNVINGGTISAPVGSAVRMIAGGKVTNWGGGGIYGAAGVAISGKAGTIKNGGVILGASGAGAGLYKGGEVVNWDAGTIIGATGVHVSGGLGQVSNTGEIVGMSSDGILLAKGGEVTNAKHGTIAGQVYGVDIAGGAGTVTNHGSITWLEFIDKIGVRLGAGGDVINASGGRIAGLVGVDLERSGDVTNARGATIAGGVELKLGGNLSNGGTISAYLGAAVLDSGAGTITNSGTIFGSGDAAIDLSSGASFTNFAAGAVSGPEGIYGDGAGPIANAGKIAATKLGVQVSNGDLTNLASGQISAANTGNYADPIGVLLLDASFDNAGSIYSQGLGVRVSADSHLINDRTGTIVATGYGVADAGTIVNDGVIKGQGNAARAIATYRYSSSASIINAGEIEAMGIAIDMADGGALLNKTGGTISGEVEMSGSGTLTNQAGATIAGLVDVNGGTVVNAGTITGMVEGSAKLVLKAGSSLANASVQTIALQGAGTADVLRATSLDEQATGTWTLTGSSSFNAATITSGTLQAGDATHPDADLVVQGMLINFATIKVVSGAMDIVGAVFGAGKAIIAGGTLELGSTFNEAVAFTGTSGVLQLAKSQSYAGAISGFSLSGGTSLDLRDIGFTSGTTTASYVDNGAHTGGVLSVTDGTHTANIKLIGNFSASTFTTSSDGAGGTTVVDPGAKAAAVSSFVAAMASFFGAAGGVAVPTADSGRWQPAFLAAAHHAG
jgi:hypothetical protein